MIRSTVLAFGLTIALAPPPLFAQAPATDPAPPATSTPAEKLPEPTGVRRFLRDVGHDYVDFVSFDNAVWAGIGGSAALVVAQYDEEWSPEPDESTPGATKPGSVYGNATVQLPLAVGWWVVGHAARSPTVSDAGRDLLRAQISAVTWSYAIKYAVGRTRPNGDPRSFPSGHASATFATATVLQKHYGWKVGLPFFGLATYTSVERVVDRKHWPSDVTFGAVVGMLSGRTVTLHLRGRQLRIQPQAVAGGGGVTIHVLP